jgi:hypothetical protein
VFLHFHAVKYLLKDIKEKKGICVLVEYFVPFCVDFASKPLLDYSQLLLDLTLFLHDAFKLLYLLFEGKDDGIVVLDGLMMQTALYLPCCLLHK